MSDNIGRNQADEPSDVRRVFIATFSTRNFDFTAVGNSKAEAVAALVDGWERHCEQYGEANRGLVFEWLREINVVAVPLGGALRDGEVI